jgi:hypothetical protein
MKVKYRDLEVEIDSLDDLDILADRLEARRVAASPTVAREIAASQVSLPPSQPILGKGEGPHSLSEFIALLTPNSRKLLRLLANSSRPLRDNELVAQLGLSNRMALAGTISTILKGRQGYKPPTLLVKTPLRGPEFGKKDAEYAIAKNVLAEVRVGLDATERSNGNGASLWPQ